MVKFLKYPQLYLSGMLIALLVISFSCVKDSAFANTAQKTGRPPVTGHIVWGAAVSPFPGENIDRKAAWIRLNDKVKSLNGGYGLQAHRTYDKGLPASWSASAMAGDVGLCDVSLGSIKPNWIETANGTNYEAIKSFVQSIPDDRVVYLTFYHEPEDNIKQKGYSAPLLQAAFAKFVDAVLAANKPNVHPCFILMSYTFRPQSKRNPDDFNMAAKLKPEQLNKVIAGLDGYAHDPEVSAKETFEGCFAKMAAWGFTRFGIFEMGTHAGKTASARADWVKDMGQWVKSRKDMEVATWFNSGAGPHAGPLGWFLGTWSKDASNNYTLADDDGSLTAYANLIKSH